MVRSFASAVLLTAFVVPASALTCGSAKLTAVETAICNDEGAADADASLNDTYWKALRSLKESDTARHDWLIEDQRSWLAHREGMCGAVKADMQVQCVVGATQARVADLASGYPEALHSTNSRRTGYGIDR